MEDIRAFLQRANANGVLNDKTYSQLLKFHDTPLAENEDGLLSDLATPSHADDIGKPVSSESPRLLRGFHDILITIGIGAFLAGVWALASVYAAIIAAIILAEIFVLRQRLAFPAFALTVIFTLAMAVGAGTLFEPASESIQAIGVFSTCMIGLFIFYLRYRIPVALAGLLVSLALTAFSLIVAAMGYLDDVSKTFETYPHLLGFIGFGLTGILFAIALRFDLNDPTRVTRRSDVAFWLHLTTAPLLAYTTLLTIFGNDGFWWTNDPQASDAVIVVAIVAVLMLIGVVIDRRAFVTSGLISLGVAFYMLTQEFGINTSNITAISAIGVGVVVLLIGSGWNRLRKFVLGILPANITGFLPPAVEST